VISGYLIAKSWINQPNLGIFSSKRILRIYPGLISAILFSTFIIGPIVSSLSFKEYFLNLNIFSIIKGSIFLSQPNLPGVFTSNIFPTAVNGSLWTLFIEASMYVVTALLGMSGMLAKKWPLVVFILLEIFACEFLDTSKIHIIGLIININAIYYLIGACYFIFKKKIKYDYRLCFLLLVIWCISFNTIFFKTVSYFSIPYIILSIAFTSTNYLPIIVGTNDYSYGLYIYAFPIQQTIVYFSRNQISPVDLFLIAYPLTLLLAIISWTCIEKKALEFKNVCFRARYEIT
jgi:peptidoglycan/LPS O-acetylase OafA/YrhL